jgi:hypothetical protein
VRRAAIATLTLFAIALTGCGTQTSTTTQPNQLTPKPSESAEPTVPTTLGAYNILAEDVNGFFAAATDAERRTPQKAPVSAEDLLAVVGYEFGDGVALAVYDDPQERICFTGPENTYLTLSEPEDSLQRTLGTGECNYDDGAVVLEVVFPDDMPGALVSERVIKGEDVARGIPALAEFADIVNASMRDDLPNPAEDPDAPTAGTN